jgi:nicotinate-nucleotide--dimethylbenzimidazole phosphoribosyltransferase
MAQAGGPDGAKAKDALTAVEEAVRKSLRQTAQWATGQAWDAAPPLFPSRRFSLIGALRDQLREPLEMNAAPRPFDDIRALILKMPGPDEAASAAAREREAQLTKPAGSLGRLEDISAFLAGWQASARPHVFSPLVAVFAGNHGVVAQGVSPFPQSVTQAMVANFTSGGAAINQICKTFDISLKVYELALEKPTGDITEEPAMDERTCAGTIAFGMEALASEPDLLALGEMGIGNTTAAAAICHALYGGEAEHWVGRGTGVDDVGLKRKAEAVRAAVARHKAHLSDPLEILARLGGREIAAMVGAILAARLRRTPVVLDGFVVSSAAAVLRALDASALDHCLAGHVSAERAHRETLKRLGKAPLLDLGMRLGEGSGAAMAVGIIKAAVACHNGMATFAEAGVSGKEG